MGEWVSAIYMYVEEEEEEEEKGEGGDNDACMSSSLMILRESLCISGFSFLFGFAECFSKNNYIFTTQPPHSFLEEITMLSIQRT